MPTKPTVAEYIISRLSELGIDHAFGVPGDYSFPFDDAIESSKKVRWIGCSNELNAAYAADGYARRRGAAILSTTYGVGELSAINGVMGAKAHRSIIFHLVGAPSTRIQRQGLLTHHALGDGDYDFSFALSAATGCVSARMTPDNVVEELERCIREAFARSQPAYIQIPQDFNKMPILGSPMTGKKLPIEGLSNPRELAAAVKAINAALTISRCPVALATLQIKHCNARKETLAFLKRSELSFAITLMDRGVLPETHPGYLGFSAGQGSPEPWVRSSVEKADVLLDLGGVVLTDINTGMWSQQLDPSKVITIGPDFVRIGADLYVNVVFKDVLAALAKSAPKVKSLPHKKTKPSPLLGKALDPITSASLYPRLQRFLKNDDNIVMEVSSLSHFTTIPLPEDAGFECQLLWGSIGWATPATLGVAIAEPKKRAILISGDGAHQMSANEIGVMGRYAINPIVIVINNMIYGVEVIVSDWGHAYDDIPVWNYHLIPEAMGCKGWFSAKIQTVGELEDALIKARHHNGGVYLEIMIPASESQPLPKDVLERIYKLQTPTETIKEVPRSRRRVTR